MTWTYKQCFWGLVIVATVLLEHLGRIEQAEVYTTMMVIIVLLLLDISAATEEDDI